MSAERPDTSKNNPEIPAGVPGDRDITFAQLDQLLHANLKGKYGTDKLDDLKRMTVEDRAGFTKQFGSPSEIIEADEHRETLQAQERAQRIRVLTQIHALQNDWNRNSSRRAIINAELTVVENRLMEIGEVAKFWHPKLWAERQRLLADAYRLRTQAVDFTAGLDRDSQAIRDLGSNTPDHYEQFVPRKFE